MIEQVKYVVEITAGHGWYKEFVGDRFLVVVDMKGSRGCAKYRVIEEPVPVYDLEERIMYLTVRYLREQDVRLIED
jgi:hypothetical protein